MDKISRIYKIEIPILIRVFCKEYNQQRLEFKNIVFKYIY